MTKSPDRNPAVDRLPWVLAGRDPADLRARAGRLADRVAAVGPEGLAELAAATVAEAEPLRSRAVFFASDGEEALRELEGLGGVGGRGAAIRGEARPGARLAFVFSPLRSEYPGAALGLIDRYPAFAMPMEACGKALEPLLGWSPVDVLGERPGAPPFPRLDVGPPLLFALGASLAGLWAAFGVRPEAVLGHSVGEIAAAVTCGALAVEDGARVAAAWGRAAMRLEGTGAMASLPLSAAETEARIGSLRGRVAISGFNAPSWTAVSGEAAAIEALLEGLAAEGVRGRPMGIGVAGHSAAMAPAEAWIAGELAGVSPRPATVPFGSAAEGRIVDPGELDAAYWSRGLCRPVRFQAAVRSLREAGFDAFLEIGPSPTLNAAVGEIIGREDAIAIGGWEQGEESRFHLQLAEAHVLGVDVDWRAFLPPRRSSVAVAAPFRRRLNGLSVRRCEQLVDELVRREAAAVLGLDGTDRVARNRAFKDLGFDSPAAVELRNRLSRATGLDLATTLVFDHPTPGAVAAKLAEELGLAGDRPRPARRRAPEPDPGAERASCEIDELDLAALVERGLESGAD